MKNKLLYIVVAALVLFGMAGCSNNEDTNTPKITVNFNSISTMHLRVSVTPNEAVSKYYTVVVSKELYPEFIEIHGGGDKTALLKNLADKNLATIHTDRVTDTCLLNGATGYEYLFVALLFDKNGNVCEPLIEMPFSSPAFVDGLAQASVAVSVSEIAPLSARLKIVPDKNTLGYYTGVVPTEYFEALTTPKALENLRMEFAYLGYLFFEPFDGLCRLTEDCADYTVVVFPFNANGADGYAPIVTTNFSATSSGKKAAIYSPEIFKLHTTGNYKKALTTKSLKNNSFY